MKKRYDIKIDTLNNLLKILSEYADDPEVARDIFRIEALINNLKNNFISSNDETLSKMIQSDLEIYPMFKPYYVYANIFAETGLSLDSLNINPTYKKLRISDEETYSVAYDFLAGHGDFFKEQLDEFGENKYSHLKFIRCNANTDGGALYLKSLDEAFVFSPNYNNFTKITILIHEMEHVIDCFNNPVLFENYIVREIAPVFKEMIAADDIASKYKLGNDNLQRRLTLHSIIKEQALVARDKMDMLSLVQKYSFLDYNKLFEKLNSEGFSLDNIKYYCKKSLEEDFYYIVAQMIAIELYFIYKKDIEYALNILKYIIMNGNDFNILDILDKYKINLGENITNYENELVHQLKIGK